MPKTKHPEPEVVLDSVWRCGGHVYLCSDLMDQSPEAMEHWAAMTEGVFPGVPRPTLCYTDPPWGQGLANTFRTKAGLGRAEYDWTDIYRSIAELASALGIPAWFEGPAIERPDGMKIPGVIMQSAGYRLYRQITYMGGNAAGLYYASQKTPPPAAEWVHRAGFAVVWEVLSQYPPGVLMDPCAGLGGIPLVAQQLGWMSVNNELNPQRMGRALARMADACGSEPVRIA